MMVPEETNVAERGQKQGMEPQPLAIRQQAQNDAEEQFESRAKRPTHPTSTETCEEELNSGCLRQTKMRKRRTAKRVSRRCRIREISTPTPAPAADENHSGRSRCEGQSAGSEEERSEEERRRKAANKYSGQHRCFKTAMKRRRRS